MLEKLFHLSKHNTSARTEILAGLTTFLTMAYIIFVQPAVLSGQMFHFDTGMNFYAIAAALTLILRLLIHALASPDNPSPLLHQLAQSRLMTQFCTPWEVPSEAWNPLYVLSSLKETAGKMDLVHAQLPS